MESAHWSPVLRYIRKIAAPKNIGQIPDEDLLHRFVTMHDEEAFAALVKRHASMVMGVCRRVLNDSHAAEDVFQATFLVLVRKARSIAKPGCLGPWLYGVAYRTALRARSDAAKRCLYERRTAIHEAESNPEVVWPDLRPILDEEIQGLPRKYRAPLVLCYFEGKTKEEAARLLGLPVGTVSSQLARAREKLRGRLTRRGLVLSTGILISTLSQKSLADVISTTLMEATVKAGLAWAMGKPLTMGAISLKAVSLAEGMVKSMFLSKLKTATAILLGATLIGSGVGVVTYRAAVAQEKSDEPSQEDKLRQEIARLKNELEKVERKLEGLKPDRAYIKVPAHREGVISLIGTEIKEGEDVPANQRISKQYRRLKVGDRVEPELLLGRVDDRLARDEMTIKEQKLLTAKAELGVSEKTRDEAKQRYETQLSLYKQKGTTQEELRGAKLTWDKYMGEVFAKQAQVTVAEAELNQTRTVVEMHNIRSPIRGVIRSILKHPGEAVQSLETVFLIQPDE
jgi:RNA polymerase sigma factor (sigma-70 family)